MSVVIFFTSLDLVQKSSLLDGTGIKRKGTRGTYITCRAWGTYGALNEVLRPLYVF
jgi:hypothetical protein